MVDFICMGVVEFRGMQSKHNYKMKKLVGFELAVLRTEVISEIRSTIGDFLGILQLLVTFNALTI